MLKQTKKKLLINWKNFAFLHPLLFHPV